MILHFVLDIGYIREASMLWNNAKDNTLSVYCQNHTHSLVQYLKMQLTIHPPHYSSLNHSISIKVRIQSRKLISESDDFEIKRIGRVDLSPFTTGN